MLQLTTLVHIGIVQLIQLLQMHVNRKIRKILIDKKDIYDKTRLKEISEQFCPWTLSSGWPKRMSLTALLDIFNLYIQQLKLNAEPSRNRDFKTKCTSD